MTNLSFFAPSISSEKELFNAKLAKAIQLIQANHSIVAINVLNVINSDKITINSFFNLSKQHYQRMKKNMLKDENIILPEEYPPTLEAIRMIEKKLSGIIYDDKHIYLSSQNTIEQIASSLVHEVCHFLNADIYMKEQKKAGSLLYRYHDEVRAFTAEKIFERDGHCIRRSDIRTIHQKVSELYPEFLEQEIDTQKLGYIFASYDMPKI